MLNEGVIQQLICAANKGYGELLGSLTESEIHDLEQGIKLLESLKRGDTIASLWSLEDVYSLVDDGEGNSTIEITKDEARAVLALAERNHDAEVGINWDSLRCHLDSVLEERTI